MTRRIRTKICGLSTADTIAAAVAGGTAYIGFNFFPKSPRYVTPETARDLALEIPEGVAKVALVVDPDDALLDSLTAIVPIDIIQLHGHETPDRVREVRARYGLPVMKAVGIRDAGDLDALAAYEAVADILLVDAKPPKDAVLSGGNGVAFDWELIAGRRWTKPWLLAGGLTADNVAEAIRLTGARQVDLSSGVETAPGVKDVGMIQRFLDAAG